MRFASMGSGSEGNGLVIASHDGLRERRVLIDCGFGPRRATERLEALGVPPESLSAILVTHEHSDHIGGVFKLALRHDLPVFITHGTLHAARVPDEARPLVRPLCAGDRFEVEGLQVHAVPVPHDAREPVQFIIDDGRCRLGVLTDLGHASPLVERAFAGLDGLVLECNHDPGLLAENPRYPPHLKRRIGGPFGHLANAAAAELLARLDPGRLKRLVAAHLSAHNNRPELARSALAGVLNCRDDEVEVADQAGGLAWRTLS